MLALPRARPAQKIRLPSTAIVAGFEHDVEDFWPSVDDDVEPLAREGRERQGGQVIDANPGDVLDAGARFTWSATYAEGSGAHCRKR